MVKRERTGERSPRHPRSRRRRRPADPAPLRAPCARQPLQGRGIALYFEKPSARTRNSMEMAAVQLGAHRSPSARTRSGSDARDAEDVARTLPATIRSSPRGHDIGLSAWPAVETPVLNMLRTGRSSAAGAGRLLTIQQLMADRGCRSLRRRRNNVARSLPKAARCSAPSCVAPRGNGFSSAAGSRQVGDPPRRWPARGYRLYRRRVGCRGGRMRAPKRTLRSRRTRSMHGLLAGAPVAWFLHCLPARPREEVTDEGSTDRARRCGASREPHAQRARGASLDAGRAAVMRLPTPSRDGAGGTMRSMVEGALHPTAEPWTPSTQPLRVAVPSPSRGGSDERSACAAAEADRRILRSPPARRQES
jgi:ornithine carbamoyltransferase